MIEPYMESPYMVFIGDSIISGYPEHQSFIQERNITNIPTSISNHWARKVNRNYQNMGYDGQSTNSLNNRFNSDVVDLSPEFVLIEGGVNDINSDGSLRTTTLVNWESMIQKAYNNNITPVIMLILPCGTRCSDAKRDMINYVNEELIKLAANYPNSIVVDARCYVGVEHPNGPSGNCWDINASYTPDGLHFNSDGHERIAQAIKDSFRFVHGKPGLYNLIQSDGTIIYSRNLNNSVNTSWRMASTAGTANVSYNEPAAGEVANLTVHSGTIDWFNINNISSNPACSLYSNGVQIDSKEAVNNSVNFTNNMLPGTYYVQCTIPHITSWGNNKTNDENLNITINTTEIIIFNATADQYIDNWNWFIDDTPQINNFDNFTTSWNYIGKKTIRLHVTNTTNGVSDPVKWTVIVKDPNSYTIGKGNWGSDVSLTNTTFVQSTGNTELKWMVNDYISRWRMDGGTGNIIPDENTTSGNDCTLYGTGWVSGGIEFDSDTDYINCGVNKLTNMKALTYAADIKPSISDSTPRYIMGVMGPGSNWYKILYIQDMWSLRHNNLGSASNTRRYSANNALNQGTRQNVISTWSGGTSGTSISLYVDNALTQYSLTRDGDSIADDSGSVFVLGNRLDLTRPYRGTLYEAMVFNRVLSA
ncbi:MAG: GDSL-type esterase/lipase family protein, partial [Candidatus Methanoperedens sp.]|nr:GDSL-type esterase/lipase family protein [Candidatus Methanoperedens sp.]